MSLEEIIEKAKKVGINPYSNSNQTPIENIADSLGMNDYSINDIENTLNDILNEDSTFLIDNEVNEPEELYSLTNNDMSNNHNHFGQREYNMAKNKDGVYDKNYYKNKQNELDEKVKEAKENVANKTKEEPDLDKDGNANWKDGETPKKRTWKNGKETTEGLPTKTVNKTRSEKLKDRAELLKAQKNRLQNKINGAKAKFYNTMHPGEYLKDKAKSTVKNLGKSAGKVAKNATKKGAKALLNVIKKNPYILLGIGIAILLVIVLSLLISASAVNSDNTTGYCNSLDENNFSIVSTPFSESEFITKVSNYYISLAEKDRTNCYDYFTNKEVLKTIYNSSLENFISPEFTLVTAYILSCSPNINNNIWNLYCDDEFCSFETLEEGIIKLGTKLGNYNTLSEWIKNNYDSNTESNMEVNYTLIRDKIFYDGNYNFNCEIDYSSVNYGDGEIFKQGDPRWKDIHLGKSNSTMGSSGCAVTSVANGINRYASYITIADFDAGKFVEDLNAGNCFTEEGCIYWGCKISEIAPGVSFEAKIGDEVKLGDLSNYEKINYLNKYIHPSNPDDKYFLIIGYSNPQTRSHYVLFNGLIDEDKYNSFDPSSRVQSDEAIHLINEINVIVVYKYS